MMMMRMNLTVSSLVVLILISNSSGSETTDRDFCITKYGNTWYYTGQAMAQAKHKAQNALQYIWENAPGAGKAGIQLLREAPKTANTVLKKGQEYYKNAGEAIEYVTWLSKQGWKTLCDFYKASRPVLEVSSKFVVVIGTHSSNAVLLPVDELLELSKSGSIIPIPVKRTKMEDEDNFSTIDGEVEFNRKKYFDQVYGFETSVFTSNEDPPNNYIIMGLENRTKVLAYDYDQVMKALKPLTSLDNDNGQPVLVRIPPLFPQQTSPTSTLVTTNDSPEESKVSPKKPTQNNKTTPPPPKPSQKTGGSKSVVNSQPMMTFESEQVKLKRSPTSNNSNSSIGGGGGGRRGKRREETTSPPPVLPNDRVLRKRDATTGKVPVKKPAFETGKVPAKKPTLEIPTKRPRRIPPPRVADQVQPPKTTPSLSSTTRRSSTIAKRSMVPAQGRRKLKKDGL